MWAPTNGARLSSGPSYLPDNHDWHRINNANWQSLPGRASGSGRRLWSPQQDTLSPRLGDVLSRYLLHSAPHLNPPFSAQPLSPADLDSLTGQLTQRRIGTWCAIKPPKTEGNMGRVGADSRVLKNNWLGLSSRRWVCRTPSHPNLDEGRARLLLCLPTPSWSQMNGDCRTNSCTRKCKLRA